MRWLILCSMLFLAGCQKPDTSNVLETIIETHRTPLGAPAQYPEKFELQIIYTQVDRNADNHPQFSVHSFNLDDEHYFYPASTVKLPTAVLALEKISALTRHGVDHESPLSIGAARPPQTPMDRDETARDQKPTIGHFIRQVFLTSDNNAHNRLYEFVGQAPLNERLRELGFTGTQIVHRIGPDGVNYDDRANRYTNPFEFHGDPGFVQAEAFADKPVVMRSMKGLQKGKGHFANGEFVHEPKDFSTRNRFSLSDMDNFLKRVIFPEAFPDTDRFQLSETDYRFLYEAMSIRPRESLFPHHGEEYYDSYVKFFIYGDREDPIPDNVRIFNKVGWAYGYLTDVAYVVDFDANIEFFLTAVISVNENQIYNDDVYEYETIGLPFLAELGRLFYNYELNRDRAVTPDLSKFKF